MPVSLPLQTGLVNCATPCWEFPGFTIVCTVVFWANTQHRMMQEVVLAVVRSMSADLGNCVVIRIRRRVLIQQASWNGFYLGAGRV